MNTVCGSAQMKCGHRRKLPIGEMTTQDRPNHMEGPMDLKLHQLNRRLNWCHQLRIRTGTRDEKEGWLAEEKGLRDALCGRDRTDLIRVYYPSQVERYRLGFHDGQALVNFSSGNTMASHL